MNPVMVPEHKANFGSNCIVGPVAVAVGSAHSPVTADLEGWFRCRSSFTIMEVNHNCVRGAIPTKKANKLQTVLSAIVHNPPPRVVPG